jgi:hypothetical protein
MVAGDQKTGESWKLRLAVTQQIHLPGIAALASWMLPQSVGAYIPKAIMPFDHGLDILDVDMDFDMNPAALRSINFTIKNTAKWQVIQRYLAVDDTRVSVQISNIGNTWQIDHAVVRATLIVGDAGILFTASKTDPAVPWVLTGALQDKISLDFSRLLRALKLDTKFSLPSYSWLTKVELTALAATVIPEDGKFELNGTSSITWHIPFLNLQLPLTTISGQIAYRSLKSDTPNNYFKATLSGNFNFNTLKTVLALQLGSASIETVFTGTLTALQLQDFKLIQFADGLVANQAGATPGVPSPDDNQWSKLTPNDMLPLEYARASVYFNQTQSQFWLYGTIKNFGDAIFLSQTTTKQQSKRGYVFAFALSPDFKFASLLSALAPVDDFLKVSNAGMVVTSYTIASADTLVQQINDLILLDTKPGEITHPIKQGKLPVGEVPPGIHLYAQLLLTGPLFSKFSQLTTEDPLGLNVTLYAFISTGTAPAEGSAGTIFKATFAPFSLVNNLISFKAAPGTAGIIMQYTRGKSSEFSLSGIIGLNIFSRSYEFAGVLVVNNDKTRFTMSNTMDTLQGIQLFPEFMPPLFVLKQPVMDVIYYFKTPARLKKYLELRLSSQVELVDTIFLDSSLYLLNGKPVLALIPLTRDFSLSQLIRKLVGNDQSLSGNVFDITFKADTPARPSRVYYYDPAADTVPSKINVAANKYEAGYHLESVIELKFFTTVTVLLNVSIERNRGMVANAALTNSIRMSVLEFAGTEPPDSKTKKYKGSPTLNLDTNGEVHRLSLSTGINLLCYPFGTADIDISNNNSEINISGNITSVKKIPAFDQLTVGFEYCNSKGLKITFPGSLAALYKSADMAIDILRAIKKKIEDTNRGAGCEEAVDFVMEAGFVNSFTMNPSFKQDPNNKKYYFVVDGDFKISMLGFNICTIGFKDIIHENLEDQASFDDLDQFIQNMLKRLPGAFVDALFANKMQLAVLCGLLFFKHIAVLAGQLFCRELVNAAIEAIMVAIGNAVAAVISDAAGFLIFFDLIRVVIGDGPDAIAKKIMEHKPVTRVMNLVFNIKGNKLHADWLAVPDIKGFHAVLLDGTERLLEKDDFKPTECSWEIDIDRISGKGPFKIALTTKSNNGEQANWTVTSENSVERIAPPQLLTWQIDTAHSCLLATWANVNGNKGYHAELLDNGRVALKKMDLPANTTAWDIPLDIIRTAAGPLTFRVMVKALDPALLDSVYQEFGGPPITRCQPPEGLKMLIDATNSWLTATWINVPKNKGYHYELWSGNEVCMEQITAPGATKFQIHYQMLAKRPGYTGPFKIRLFTRSAEDGILDSLFTDFSAPSVERYSAPTSVKIAWNEQTRAIDVSWNSDNPVSTIQVYLKEAATERQIARKWAAKNISGVSFGPADFIIEHQKQYFAELQVAGDDQFMPSIPVISDGFQLPAPGPAAQMHLVSGNNQTAPFTDPADYIYFSPLQILVTDARGVPVPGTQITFKKGTFAAGMEADLSLSQDPEVMVNTGNDGLATLHAMFGYSLRCSKAQGPIYIHASGAGQPLTFTLTVGPTPPQSNLAGSQLTIESGNNQVVNRRPDGATAKGSAWFLPLSVKLTDADGKLVKGALVKFFIEHYPTALEIDPSSLHLTYAFTGDDGIATLSKYSAGYSIRVYERIKITISASVKDGPKVLFDGEVPS